MKVHNESTGHGLHDLQAMIVAVLMLFASGTGLVQAQTNGRKITGKVIDENNQPMPGVTVLVERTTNGTMTDEKGTFVLGNVPDNAVVVVSCIGYVTQKFKDSKTEYNVKLVPDTEVLDEVVMVAYGQQRKVSVTGSIATVSSQDLRKTTTTRLDNALAGRVTGLSSLQNAGGQPGVDGATMYLRGASTLNGKSPLVLVDGVERDNIRTIDMNEVESISVLKDASATALYGIEGANGVILIQTRQGQKGKPQLNVTVDQSWISFTRTPKRLHSWEYCELRNEALTNDGLDPAYSEEVINKYRDPLQGLDPAAADYETQKKMRLYMYPDNDWYNMYLKKNTPQTRANVNVSGGIDFVKYFLNFGYIHQGGNLNTEDPDKLGYNPQCFMDRLSLRSNLDFQLARNLTASLKLASYAENVNMPAVGGMYKNDANWMITDLIYQCQTILPISPGPTTKSWFGVDDGYVLSYNYLDRTAFEIMNRRGFRKDKRKNLNAQLSMTWDLGSLITKGLSLTGMISYDTYNYGLLEGSIEEPIYTANVDYANNTLTYSLLQDKSKSMTIGNSRLSNFTIYTQATINYDRTFGKHNVTAMVLANRRNYETTDTGGVEAIPYNVIGTSARFTYSYEDKYLAEANFGYNGSEQFAPNNRFGFFPAGSIGWVASNENFLKDNPIVTWLKFRASYGEVGNDSMGNLRFLYLDHMSASGGGTSTGGLGGHTISEGKIGNKQIQWEVAHKYNLGFELGLFKDLRLNVELFKENRDHILINRQTIPQFQGVPSGNIPAVNMGKVDNKGFEVELSYSHTFNKDYSFSVKGNFGYNKNKVIEYDEPMRTDDYAYRYRVEGFRLGQAWGYKIDWNSPGKGYFTSQEEIDNYFPYAFGSPRVGDFVYKDINGDQKIDDKDFSPIGYSTSIPGIVYGINLSANIKGFDINVLFSGVGQYSKYFSGQGVIEYTKAGTFFEWTRHAWTQERWLNGEKISYPAVSTAQAVSHRQNDFFIQNRAFLRLKNIEIGYTLPFRFLSKAGVKSLRIYASGQNLYDWNHLRITHIDPEQNSNYGYPITKNVSVGVNVNF